MLNHSLRGFALKFTALTLVALVGACGPAGGGGGGGAGAGNDNGPPDGVESGVLIGQVADVDGQPIAGATVTLDDGRTATTDDNGFYSFDDLETGSQVVVRFRAAGFAATAKAFAVTESESAIPASVIMAPAAATVAIDAEATSTQRSGDSAVTIAADSLVDADGDPVTGTVDLTATYIDPSTEGVMAFPGSFETAQTQGGETVTLESFGFAIYELMQDGQEVNLAPGSTAEIEYVLPENAQDNYSVGDTIGLWEFDDQTATWMEHGQGEVREASDGSGRLAWFAIIDHFSAWNCDTPLENKHCITGSIDLEDATVELTRALQITATGLDYNGFSSTLPSVDGTFCVDVKRGSFIRIETRLWGAGAGTLLATQEKLLPDEAASCATGGCLELDEVAVALGSCVTGHILDNNGNGVAGVTVRVLPGETVVTEADGSYCARAAAGTAVFVLPENRSSIRVTTPAVATCADANCADADFGEEIGMCGNYQIDVGETCDPPNGLWCDADCQVPDTCGNGQVDTGEDCDPPTDPVIGEGFCNHGCQWAFTPCISDDECDDGDDCEVRYCIEGECWFENWCDQYGTCECCAADWECGWCDGQDGQCLAGNVLDPSGEEVCDGGRWTYRGQGEGCQ